jgi:quinol monooxygenase YgiN
MNRFVFVSLLALSACGLPTPDASCTRSALEPDLGGAGWRGAGLVNGAIPPGNYVISSTYIAMKPTAEAQAGFQEVWTPLEKSLDATDGLIAYQTFGSTQCATARTIAVWRDQMAMFQFVGSPQHTAAIQKSATISRGGGATTHWLDTEAGATLERAVEKLAADQPTF